MSIFKKAEKLAILTAEIKKETILSCVDKTPLNTILFKHPTSKADTPLMILIHPLGAYAEFYRGFIQRLQRYLQTDVLTFDSRGHGCNPEQNQIKQAAAGLDDSLSVQQSENSFIVANSEFSVGTGEVENMLEQNNNNNSNNNTNNNNNSHSITTVTNLSAVRASIQSSSLSKRLIGPETSSPKNQVISRTTLNLLNSKSSICTESEVSEISRNPETPRRVNLVNGCADFTVHDLVLDLLQIVQIYRRKYLAVFEIWRNFTEFVSKILFNRLKFFHVRFLDKRYSVTFHVWAP